jgi:hypothetical protein
MRACLLKGTVAGAALALQLLFDFQFDTGSASTPRVAVKPLMIAWAAPRRRQKWFRRLNRRDGDGRHAVLSMICVITRLAERWQTEVLGSWQSASAPGHDSQQYGALASGSSKHSVTDGIFQ